MGLGNNISLGVDTDTQSTKAIASAAGVVSNAFNSVNAKQLPWEYSSIKSTFFQSIKIDPSRWDQQFPYRLLVIDSTNNTIVQNKKGVLQPPKILVTEGTGSALIDFEPTDFSWIFQLPITPEQLTIQDQYAIQVTPTLRGIVEEHGGVRFKAINAGGSMGVWAQRSQVTTPPGSPGLLQSVFGGTIEAFGNVVDQAKSVISAATTGHPANKPTSLRPETSPFGATSTGYYQALKLQQFLEQYAEAKKDPANKSWRLVFDVPKQNQSFVVTPVTYIWNQNVNKPMEIKYTFQLKGWRRVDLNQPTPKLKPANQPLTPGILQRVLSTIGQARQTLGASMSLIGAVRSDVDTPLEVLRQTSLFVKDLAGVAIAVSDLPKQIVNDYKSSISASMSTLSTSITSITGNSTSTAMPMKINSPLPASNSSLNNHAQSAAISSGASSPSPNTVFSSSSVASSDPALRSNLNAIVNAQNSNEGLSLDAVNNGQLGNNATILQNLNPANKVFEQPYQNFSLFDQIPVSGLSLTNSQQTAVSQIVDNARETTVDTLKQFRASLLQLALQLSNNFGTGSAYYNKIFNLPPPTTRSFPITLSEFDILKSLYDVIASYDILTASTQIDDNNIQSNMEYVAGLATNSDIPFTVSVSKILVPVPFGLTIEAIAARYLANAQRWIEIATLNNLREPYIDETGFKRSLLSNAIGRQVVINSNENLYLGQKVTINSNTQSPSGRTILDIVELSPSSFMLTFDGLPNLDGFLLSDSAYLQAYLPGTVNSQQKIFIPSDLPVPLDSSIIPPASTSSDPLTGLSKVDWLMTESGDIAVNNYGDFRYASGITNIIQALKIKFGTQLGKSILHPDFGLGVKVGSISSEVQLQELYNSINKMITEDERFQSVSKLQITLNGPVLGISLGVTLPGQTGVFPISFALTS